MTSFTKTIPWGNEIGRFSSYSNFPPPEPHASVEFPNPFFFIELRFIFFFAIMRIRRSPPPSSIGSRRFSMSLVSLPPFPNWLSIYTPQPHLFRRSPLIYNDLLVCSTIAIFSSLGPKDPSEGLYTFSLSFTPPFFLLFPEAFFFWRELQNTGSEYFPFWSLRASRQRPAIVF